MKYSKNFERDFEWYLAIRHTFWFDGTYPQYHSKKGEEIVQYDEKGVSGKHAFYVWDSQGRILPTKHPNLLRNILRTKGALNLQIKEWAKGRADGTLPGIEFYVSAETRAWLDDINKNFEYPKTIAEQYLLPDWVITAVENQKMKLLREFGFK